MDSDATPDTVAPGDVADHARGCARASRGRQADGAEVLRREFHRVRELHAGGPFRGARLFEKAYLIHLLQEMVERGVEFRHSDTTGEYIEIDTQQDFEYARGCWTPGGIAR